MDTHLIPSLTLNYLLQCYIAALLVMGMIWPSLLPPHVTLAPLNQARVRNSLKPCPGARESGMPSLAGVILPGLRAQNLLSSDKRQAFRGAQEVCLARTRASLRCCAGRGAGDSNTALSLRGEKHHGGRDVRRHRAPNRAPGPAPRTPQLFATRATRPRPPRVSPAPGAFRLADSSWTPHAFEKHGRRPGVALRGALLHPTQRSAATRRA